MSNHILTDAAIDEIERAAHKGCLSEARQTLMLIGDLCAWQSEARRERERAERAEARTRPAVLVDTDDLRGRLLTAEVGLAAAREEIERLKRIETAARRYRAAQMPLQGFGIGALPDRFPIVRKEVRSARAELDAALAEPQGKEVTP